MKFVSLTDLKRMGELGGYEMRLRSFFPLSYTRIILKKEGLALVGLSKQGEYLLEPYRRNLLEGIETIYKNKVVVARRRENRLRFTGKGYVKCQAKDKKDKPCSI